MALENKKLGISMNTQHILIHLSDPSQAEILAQAMLRPENFQVTVERDLDLTLALIKASMPDLLIIDGEVFEKMGTGRITSLVERFPGLPIILIDRPGSGLSPIEAYRLGVIDFLTFPIQPNEFLDSVRRALARAQNWKKWIHSESQRNTKSLRMQLDELKTLGKISRTVTSSLDLDSVLEAVVDAAVEITNAEEGSLLLIDDVSGELYMRAARNFQEDFVRTFRLPVHDSLAGEVLRTGKPLIIDEEHPQKIKTSYLVHTLIYVPLAIKGKVIGVLGVDNRSSGSMFNEHHLTLISAMADIAAIAIENAKLFTHTEIERNKLETILQNIEDCVILADSNRELLFINRTARLAFGISEREIVTGKPIETVVHNQDLLEIFDQHQNQSRHRNEITLDDGHVLNAQFTSIPDVDLVAVTMQDITRLKELNKIKSDFVNAVSHDIRSPLTAIVGYVDLIARTGSLNDQQVEYVRRVQSSVRDITELINDLLDLGKIEAGLDTGFETLHLAPIIRQTLDGLQGQLTQKPITLQLQVPADLPQVLGNPMRLRQMITNLVANAIQYTQPGGLVEVMASYEKEQVIFRVRDTGIGISPTDQPFIFEKFFRGKNVQNSSAGSGLGLSIVKSIVDNHQGRIWVDSVIGQGSTFTVVLPIAEQRGESAQLDREPVIH
jgi:two-component system, OmpR family, phosphate regulon sensor histidine kinase PhoR